MTIIEFIAVVFSLLCIILAVKKHILNWPVGLIGTAAYMVLFYREKLYADMVLQLVFISQSIYGWYHWANQQKGSNEVHVQYLNTSQRITTLLFIVIFSTLWFLLLYKYTDASTPYVDALAATISLTANWLMAKKRTDNWILWILVDVIYIFLFYYKGLYLSSFIYIVFLILSIKGLRDWSKKSHTKKDLY